MSLKSGIFNFKPLIYKELFSPSECKKILSLLNYRSKAAVYSNKSISINEDFRKVFINTIYHNDFSHWVHNRVADCVKKANKDFFRFNISYLDKLKVLEYQKGYFFDWHSDIGSGMVSNRKLSIIVFLNNKSEYEGGELLFKPNIYNDSNFEIGSMIIFPSFLWHTVKPVKKGVRFTLLGWVYGNKYR